MNLKQIFFGVLCTLAFACTLAQAQTTAVNTDYLMTLYAPTFQTAWEQYAWLNHVQCVGKMGAGAFVKYDIFVVR